MFLLWWRPPCLLRTVIVNLKGEETALRGVLWASRGSWLTLRNGAILRAGAPPVEADNDLIVHRAQVAFMQVDD